MKTLKTQGELALELENTMKWHFRIVCYGLVLFAAGVTLVYVSYVTLGLVVLTSAFLFFFPALGLHWKGIMLAKKMRKL